MGNLQILLKSPEILPWKWVWSSWSVLIQNNFFKFSISQHLESFIHYFIHQLSSRLLRGHWQQNVHLNWCHSIFSFFTNFQLSVNRQKYFDPPSWISGAEWTGVMPDLLNIETPYLQYLHFWPHQLVSSHLLQHRLRGGKSSLVWGHCAHMIVIMLIRVFFLSCDGLWLWVLSKFV